MPESLPHRAELSVPRAAPGRGGVAAMGFGERERGSAVPGMVGEVELRNARLTEESYRVLQSRCFSRSQALKTILEFVVREEHAGRGHLLKEYAIATGALNRPESFDPRTDNIVRVEMRQLRKKLAEYYASEGAADPVQIRIPLRSYRPEFAPAVERVEVTLEDAATVPAREPAWPGIGKNWSLAVMAILVVAAIALAAWRPKAGNDSPQVDASLRFLWLPFLDPAQPPVTIIYSSAASLVGRHGSLPCRAPFPLLAPGAIVPNGYLGPNCQAPKRAGGGKVYFIDSRTGIGEVAAAARVAEVLARSGRRFAIEPSAIASLQDVRDSNAIFLGGTLENDLLKELPAGRDFVFDESRGAAMFRKLRILDTSNQRIYEIERDAQTGALKVDYALISRLPGLSPGRRVLVLAGLTTLGTQAAAEFATSPSRVARMKALLWRTSPGQVPPYFQVLLRVTIRGGIPVATRLVEARSLDSQLRPLREISRSYIPNR